MTNPPTINKSRMEAILQNKLSIKSRLLKPILGFCLLFISLGVGFVRPTHAAPQSSLSLSVQNQQFSANISRAPLEQVLATLTSYRPIRFVIKGDVKNDQISSSFRHLSLQESLEKILVKYDFAIIQHRFDPPPKNSEFSYLTEVVILSRNHSETLSDSKENLVISPSKNSSTPERVFPSPTLESWDSLGAFDPEREINPREFLEEVEEVIQDTDSESLAFIKKLLEE